MPVSLIVCVTDTVVAVAAVLIAGALVVVGGVVSLLPDETTMLSIFTEPCETMMVTNVVPPPELFIVNNIRICHADCWLSGFGSGVQ